jgi:ribosomal protein L29
MKRKEQMQNFKNKSEKELANMLEKNYKQLQSLRFLASFGKQKDLKKARMIRKEIARIWTILGEKYIANSPAGG